MKKIFVIVFTIIFGLINMRCTDGFLDKEPTTILTQEAVWSNEELVIALIGDLYNRVPHGSFNRQDMQFSGEVIWTGSGNGENFTGDIPIDLYSYRNYANNQGTHWDYELIREINLFIENAISSSFDQEVIDEFVAEARFIRAFAYFELVRRFGGVPIITETFEFEGTDEESLQFPRDTEEGVYDFIASELDAIAGTVSQNPGSIRRASRWSVLALKSRAMLYAASIAKYNSSMASPVTLSNGEVGISPGKADAYFQTALAAAQEIINSGNFALFPDYYGTFMTKNGNDEMIFVDDFELPGKRTSFTYWNSFPSAREDDEGGQLSPVLEFVEAFEYLDGSSGELNFVDALGEPVYYDEIGDIFDNKDLRLAGSVVLPGMAFRGQTAQIQAGIIQWNSATARYDTLVTNSLGSRDDDGNIITGFDGPSSDINISNTGFYMRKFVSEAPGAGSRTNLADNWWAVFRYAEVLLNAAEAAFELGQTGIALSYVNEVRERAGFGANSLASLTLDRLRNERRVEMAFETSHRFFDLRRWRIAHQVFDGITKPNGAYPYLVLHEGQPFHEKFVYVKTSLSRLQSAPARNFVAARNYYSEIPVAALENNPKLVRNPGH